MSGWTCLDVSGSVWKVVDYSGSFWKETCRRFQIDVLLNDDRWTRVLVLGFNV